MTVEDFKLISNLQGYAPLLTVLVVALKYKTKPSYIKWIGWMSLFSVLIHASYVVDFMMGTGKNNTIGNIFALLEPAFLFIIYSKVVNTKPYTRVLIIVYVLFVIFHISNILLLQKNHISSFSRVFSSSMIIGLTVHFFFHMLNKLPAQRLVAYPMFWINSALLLFAASTFTLHIFVHYLVNVLNDDLLTYWTFHNIMRLVLCILIAIGVWQDLKPRLHHKSIEH